MKKTLSKLGKGFLFFFFDGFQFFIHILYPRMIFQACPFGDNAVRITHVVDDVRLIDRQIRIELDRKLRFGEIPLPVACK